MSNSTEAPAQEQLNIQLENLPSLDKLVGSVATYRTSNEPLLQLVGGVTGPFENREDFERKALITVDTLVRIYSSPYFAGEIVVPEPYAVELDRVRAMRMAALVPATADTSAVRQGLSCNEAQAGLELSEYRNRLLPEEVFFYLKEMPESGYFWRVFMHDNSNPRDLWLRKFYKDDSFTSAMEVMRKTGELRLFRTERNEFLRLNLLHEWAHLLETRCTPEEWRFFSDGVALEWPFYVPDTYAYKSYEEHWAVVGQDLLHADASRFLKMLEKGPIRTVAFMTVLERALSSVPAPMRSPYHQQLLARCAHTRNHGVPLAKANLDVALRAAAHLGKLSGAGQ
jgi:hypothetical protein